MFHTAQNIESRPLQTLVDSYTLQKSIQIISIFFLSNLRKSIEVRVGVDHSRLALPSDRLKANWKNRDG